MVGPPNIMPIFHTTRREDPGTVIFPNFALTQCEKRGSDTDLFFVLGDLPQHCSTYGKSIFGVAASLTT